MEWFYGAKDWTKQERIGVNLNLQAKVQYSAQFLLSAEKMCVSLLLFENFVWQGQWKGDESFKLFLVLLLESQVIILA